MIDGTYALEVDTPLGRKSGTIELITKGDELRANLNAPIVGERHGKGKVDGNMFTTGGSAKIPLLGTFEYTVQGEVMDDILSATLHTSKGDFNVVGVRVA